MTKIFSYSIVHYGASYLDYALRSVSPLVDRSYVFYTPHPSHGHSIDSQPIESRQVIQGSISDWSKITWVDTNEFHQEGPQRDFAVNTLIADGADIILVLDYDEIWDASILSQILHFVKGGTARYYLVNMYHFWRSFNWACMDDGWPVRVIDTYKKEGTIYVPTTMGRVYHFGYAIPDPLMKYKMSFHGHKGEWRHEWYTDKWDVWPPPGDCHPTNGRKDDGTGWWDPKPFDKTQLPKLMHSHPYYDVERID